jgi:hypothetical protein
LGGDHAGQRFTLLGVVVYHQDRDRFYFWHSKGFSPTSSAIVRRGRLGLNHARGSVALRPMLEIVAVLAPSSV